MEQWYMEYKVGDKVMLRMEAADGEDYELFRAKCVTMLANYVRLYPEFEGVGHASIDDNWTTRQIW